MKLRCTRYQRHAPLSSFYFTVIAIYHYFVTSVPILCSFLSRAKGCTVAAKETVTSVVAGSNGPSTVEDKYSR